MESLQSSASPVLRRIESISVFDLSENERAALVALPMQQALFEAGQDIVCEHDQPDRSFAILSGIAATYKTTRAGGRQVMAYHITGDVPDFQSLHLKVLDNSIAAATACRVGFIRHDAVRSLFEAHPRLAGAFWRATLIDASIMREWLLNNSRRETNARMAHLLCELLMRLEMVGLAHDHTCALPLTQVELADALSVTSVHVNRVLRALRGAGLITLRGGQLAVHDWTGLTALAEFDPAYLHLRHKVA